MGEFIEEINIISETTNIDIRHLPIGKYTIVLQSDVHFATVPLTVIR